MLKFPTSLASSAAPPPNPGRASITRWKILAHEASSQGIPPNKITNPMPDLRAEYYARCGSACYPEADAKKAKEW